MVAALQDGELDLVGIGRPMIADPLSPAKILHENLERVSSVETTLNPFHLLAWLNLQMERLAEGLQPDLALDGEEAVARFAVIEQKNLTDLLRYREIHHGQPALH